MLSLAALHLAPLVPGRSKALEERALEYHNLAARKAVYLLPIPEEGGGYGNNRKLVHLFHFHSILRHLQLREDVRTASWKGC
ncbi:hypothetical protein GQ53DRAFT_882148 [Thozetella sp. PMI_491]|nr:hypothetical protein GQ53DRAFT_882148 [Thozetella sp. PMI_491]